MSIENPQDQVPEKGSRDKELLLENTAFKRFARGFAEYQEILQTVGTQNEKDVILQRMHRFYTPKEDLIDEKQKKVRVDVLRVIEAALQDCEGGVFSSDQLADLLVSSKISSLFLKEWNKKAGDVDEDLGIIYANETIAYSQEQNIISIHVRPTAAEDSDLIKSVIAGLKQISASLQEGSLQADKILMKSWLLSGSLEKMVRKIFGNDVLIRDVSSLDQDIDPTQHLAVQYNQRMMRKYLQTGEMPEVRQIEMTRDEFIANFTKL